MAMEYISLKESELAKIKVGDRLFIQEGCYSNLRLETVSRVTATLIIVGEGKNRWQRFHKHNGYQQGRSMNSYHIAKIATPAEIASFEAEQAKQKRVADEREQARQAAENKRNELRGLFADSNYVGVSQSHDTRCPEGDCFEVRLLGLTEVQVRKLAELVKGL